MGPAVTLGSVPHCQACTWPSHCCLNHHHTQVKQVAFNSKGASGFTDLSYEEQSININVSVLQCPFI